jgi:tetratricopeptide (TPR) repeat protein
MGKGGRIYCVIVDGDPQSTDPLNSCFPPALLEREDFRVVEPLAADVRSWADGKPLAKLKLASSILGVRLDELRQREQQRRRKLRAISAIAVIAVAALVIFSVQSRLAEKEARLAQEAQQTAAEGMLARFLEQSERLGDVADLETRKAFSEVMSSYLADLDPADLTPESRRQLGVTLSNRGVILRAEGHLEQALEVFQSAQQTLQLLVEASEADQDSLFELSQVEFWIGQVHLDLGQMEDAGTWFARYADASDTLHRMQPDNADWTMEAAYAQSNLGNLESRKNPSDPFLALRYYQSALEFNELAARQDESYERELADSHADVADAFVGVCDLGQALTQRMRSVDLAAKHHRLSPASKRLKQIYAHTLSGLSRVQQKKGEVELAIESLGESIDLQQELVAEDPRNLRKRWSLLIKSAYMLQLKEFSASGRESWETSRKLEQNIRELMSEEQDIRIDYEISFAMFLRDFAYRAYRADEPVVADRLLEESISELTEVASEHPGNKKTLLELAMSYFHYWERHDGELPDASARTWLERSKKALNLEGCPDLDVASRQSLIEHNREEARSHAIRLMEKGYQEPEFKRYCLEYGLCSATGQ